ncbi:MAG: hypothetical protein AAFR81_00445 [Chloroflexota bacterium]
MSVTLPRLGTKARFLLIGYGLCLLVWMSLEDNSLIPVIILGTGLSVISTIYTLLDNIPHDAVPLPRFLILVVFTSTAIGGFAPLAIALLMFFKTSWHAHAFPDYPPALMLAMLSRLPAWTLAGFLVGCALAIFTVLRQSPSYSDL